MGTMDERPEIEAVARVLYESNRRPNAPEWGALKDNAVLPQGRRGFYIQTVKAVYSAMDRVQ